MLSWAFRLCLLQCGPSYLGPDRTVQQPQTRPNNVLCSPPVLCRFPQPQAERADKGSTGERKQEATTGGWELGRGDSPLWLREILLSVLAEDQSARGCRWRYGLQGEFVPRFVPLNSPLIYSGPSIYPSPHH